MEGIRGRTEGILGLATVGGESQRNGDRQGDALRFAEVIRLGVPLMEVGRWKKAWAAYLAGGMC